MSRMINVKILVRISTAVLALVAVSGIALVQLAQARHSYRYSLSWEISDDLDRAGEVQLGTPSGVAVGPDGSVYVSATRNNKIHRYNRNGNLICKWGGPISYGGGDGNGEFDDPYGIAVDRGGNVYVADSGNNRIQKFDACGRYMDQWGGFGGRNGELASPYGVAADRNGNIYVADTYNHRIQKFDSNGNHIQTWGGEGGGLGRFRTPYDISVDSAGNVYVADSTNSRIQKLDVNGNFTRWDDPDIAFVFPSGIATDTHGNVYVSDAENDRVYKLDASGDLLTSWGQSGSANGRFDTPYDLAVNGTGSNVYVADTYNNRVQKFNGLSHVKFCIKKSNDRIEQIIVQCPPKKGKWNN